MKIKQYYIYSANLNPNYKSEPGKIRPVVVFQTDLLNKNNHPSTIICPITTNLISPKLRLLRFNINCKSNCLKTKSAILIDQIRSIDNTRFRKQIGKLTKPQIKRLRDKISKILFT